MTEDDLEVVATLDTLTDEDIDASLDGWLGKFALTLYLPSSPTSHNMAIRMCMTLDRDITILDLDGGRPKYQN